MNDTKRWIVEMHVGYAGMDGYDALVMPADATEEEVQHEAWLMALQHAESYGYYPPNEDNLGDEFGDEDGDWDSDHISDNIDGYAVPYNPELHDMHKSGGGSFEDDFLRLER